MKKGIIVPSLASACQINIEREVEKVIKEGATELHCDIEDGNFIPNITFGMSMLQEIRKQTQVNLQIHLMVTNPLDYLENLVQLRPLSAVFHVEAAGYPLEVLHRFKAKGIMSGVAFQPSTVLESYAYVLKEADICLIMMCEPDGRGQQYLPSMESKVEYFANQYPDKELWVDGGLTINTAKRVLTHGNMKLIMGRTVFKGTIPLNLLQEKIDSGGENSNVEVSERFDTSKGLL